jgi:ATP-dependent DNA helicase PIF1
MQSLEGEQHHYKSFDGGTIQDLQQRTKLLSNFMATDCLSLRLGAQVMLIKNIDENLVNGSMGRVVAFCDPASHGGIRDEDLGKVGAKGAVGHAVKVGPGEKYPEVEFTIGKTSIKRLVVPETWKTELPDGTVQVSRTQVNRMFCRFPFGSWLCAAAAHLILGHVNPQIAGSNARTSQSWFGQGFWERSLTFRSW